MTALTDLQKILQNASIPKMFMSYFSVAWDRTTGRVGPPISSTEIKLVSWAEGWS